MRKLKLSGLENQMQPETSLVDREGNPLRLNGFYYNPNMMTLKNHHKLCRVISLSERRAILTYASSWSYEITSRRHSQHLEPLGVDAIHEIVDGLRYELAYFKRWIKGEDAPPKKIFGRCKKTR